MNLQWSEYPKMTGNQHAANIDHPFSPKVEVPSGHIYFTFYHPRRFRALHSIANNIFFCNNTRAAISHFLNNLDLDEKRVQLQCDKC